MKEKEFKPVLESIPNISSYAPSVLYGKSVRISLGSSGEAEICFTKPTDDGLLDITVSHNGSTQHQAVICHVAENSIDVQPIIVSSPNEGIPHPSVSSFGFGCIRLPKDHEWDEFMDAIKGDNTLSNWEKMHSWMIDKGSMKKYRAIRGYISAHFWSDNRPAARGTGVGFRPVFEPLSPIALANGTSIVVGSLYMDGNPVPVPQNPVSNGDIADYIPGAKLEMREALGDPKYQVRAVKVDNILICDRNLLKMISWEDLASQGFVPCEYLN